MPPARKPPSSSRVARSARLGGLVAGQGARWAGGQALDKLRSDEGREDARRDRTMAIAEEIVDQLGKMKGAAMKVGQVLSTVDLPTLAPEDAERFKGKLAALRDQAPSVPFKALEKLLREEWGESPSSVLAELDPEPAAAASIGQVHRGVTKEGQDVAVKIQYPGIAEAVDSDMRNLRLLLPLVKRLAPNLEGGALMDELRERVAEECDYELEAQQHRRVARTWRRHPYIFVPDVYTDISTRRVLVTDWVDGLAFPRVREQPEDVRDRVGEILFRFYYGTVRLMHSACGDPHPGNYLLRPDGSVGFLDFGLMRKLPPGHLEREAEVVRAIISDDPERLKEVMDGLGYLPVPEQIDPKVLWSYMMAAGDWMLRDPQPRRLDPALARSMILELNSREHVALVRKMGMPAEVLLLRRMENLLFTVCTDLRARADWRAITQEIVAGEPPATQLGMIDAAWRAERHGAAA